MAQVKEVPRRCRRCRETVPHELFENISRGWVLTLSFVSFGIAYPILDRYHKMSKNRCLFCNAVNNGPYFSRQRKRERERERSSTHSLESQ